MLRWANIHEQIDTKSDMLFAGCPSDDAHIQNIWKSIAHDDQLAQRVADTQGSISVPSWDGCIGIVIPVERDVTPVQVVSVDGSQVYPDRHQGVSSYLINIGIVCVPYGLSKPVLLESYPYVFGMDKDLAFEHLSTDLVNLQRQELEFLWGNRQVCTVRTDSFGEDIPTVLLCDGSYIVWVLESTHERLKSMFAATYQKVFSQLYHERVLVAGYISVPRSREILSVVRLAAAGYVSPVAQDEFQFPYATDLTVLTGFLEVGFRTIVFKHNGALNSIYPSGMEPYFFYLNVGAEIVRIEIPAWIARDEVLVNHIASVAYDQAVKGNGYPVVLAEAHEMAVITGADREFFYHLLGNAARKQGYRTVLSPKLARKKTVTF